MGFRGSLSQAPNESRRQEKGQVAILFALIFTFLFVLFAFVVDFGHLVNTRMNLQIAADAAAYAGAAWQARALNKIGMINYHIRQDIKEMSMRISVTHLRHNRNFPRGQQFINGNPQLANVDPFVCQQAHGYRAISGLVYDPQTNLCRNADPSTGGLPPIVVPPVIASFDPFAVAITQQITRIRNAAAQECSAAADDNRILAQHLINVFSGRANFHSQQIRDMVQWMNSVAGENPASSNHPLVKAAFESARRNLSLAANDEFKFEILQPQGNEYIRLEQAQMRGTVFYINFQNQGGGCVGRPGFTDFDTMPSTFTKVPGIVTYFAVKLSAKPKLLFMPARWAADAFPELVAYSAAKPFGSRIGPRGTTDQLVPVPNRPGNVSRYVNFSFKPGDNMGIYNTKIMAYLDALHTYNSVGSPQGEQNAGWPEPNKSDDIRQPLQAIRAPTIFDALFFPIYPDPGGTKNQDYLEPQYAEALYPDYLEAADPAQNSILNYGNPRTPAYLPQGVGSRNNGPGWIQINANASGAGGPYQGYAEEQLASHSVTGVSSLPGMRDPADFGWASREVIHSSWAPEGRTPRIGYSVKFIGMDALMRTLRVELDTGNQGPIANPPTGDPNLINVYH